MDLLISNIAAPLRSGDLFLLSAAPAAHMTVRKTEALSVGVNEPKRLSLNGVDHLEMGAFSEPSTFSRQAHAGSLSLLRT